MSKTSKLTLKFSSDISGLSKSDLQFNLGTTNTTLGSTLQSLGGGIYELPVVDVGSTGQISVVVAKSGYVVSNSSRSTTVYDAGVVPLSSFSFLSVTADGSASALTTKLTLTFSADVTGLVVGDLTLSTGATKGTLVKVSGKTGVYELTVTGISSTRSITVTVSHSGLTFIPTNLSVQVYYYVAPVAVAFSSLTANGDLNNTTTLLTLVFNQDITGFAASDITVSGATKGTLTRTGTGTYTLGISGVVSSGSVSVSVAKSGFTFNPSSQSVYVFYHQEEIIVTPGETLFNFGEDKTIISNNPWRGWYQDVELNSNANGTSNFSGDSINYSTSNGTMNLVQLAMGTARTADLNTNELNTITSRLNTARTSGVGVIFRCEYANSDPAYDNYPTVTAEPTDINIVYGHLDVINNLIKDHLDVIYLVQLGWFGPWGEWHTSRWSPRKDDPVYPRYQRQLYDYTYATLDATGLDFFIGLRRPMYIRNVSDTSIVNPYTTDTTSSMSPLTLSQAFGTSKLARSGFYNDALYADATDSDTWKNASNGDDRNGQLNWTESQCKYVPMVAEIDMNNASYCTADYSTGTPPNYDVDKNAFYVANKINLSCLNHSYAGGSGTGPYGRWQTSNAWGAGYGVSSDYNYAILKLGYRFILQSVSISNDVSSNGTFHLNLKILNDGWGTLLKKVQFVLALRNGSTIHRVVITGESNGDKGYSDPRYWAKGVTTDYDYYFRTPTGMATGSWDVYLGLIPVPVSLLTSAFGGSATSTTQERYSIHFMNSGTSNGVTFGWDSTANSGTLGFNKIGKVNIVSGSGTGSQLIQIS